MKIDVFGTGVVGRTIAGKFAELGYLVHIGTRDVEKRPLKAHSPNGKVLIDIANPLDFSKGMPQH